MSLCDRSVVADIKMNCNDPLHKGVESIGYLIRRADIDFGSVEFNANNDNIIESLPLLVGKKAVRIYQQNNAFTGTNSTVEVGTYVNGTTHNVVFVVPDQGPDVAHNIIDPLISGEEFVVILENKYKGLQKELPGSAAFQVYGFHQGAIVSAGDADKYSDDTLSGWSITLTESRAPKSEMYLYATSYAATKAMLEAMVTAE